MLAKVLYRLGFLENSQYQFVCFARENTIEYGDATKGLQISEATVDAIYTSHMLEHLDRNEGAKFLAEAFRILRPNGIIRIAVPDIKKQIEKYLEVRDADAFIEGTLLSDPRPKSIVQRVRLLLVGTRNHQWMYDGESLSKLLKKFGFINVEIMPPGQSKIHEPGSLDLQERLSESVYVEAVKPQT